MKLINERNIEKAKNKIKNSKEKPIIVKAQDDNFNRKILEYGKFDVLLSIEPKRATLKKPGSGLNHTLAKIASKNSIAIGIDLSEIKKLNRKEKADVLSKIVQNVKIARKAKTKIKMINYHDKSNAQNLLISLGASTQQAKEAV